MTPLPEPASVRVRVVCPRCDGDGKMYHDAETIADCETAGMDNLCGGPMALAGGCGGTGWKLAPLHPSDPLARPTAGAEAKCDQRHNDEDNPFAMCPKCGFPVFGQPAVLRWAAAASPAEAAGDSERDKAVMAVGIAVYRIAELHAKWKAGTLSDAENAEWQSVDRWLEDERVRIRRAFSSAAREAQT